jgi:hypothetical protein
VEIHGKNEEDLHCDVNAQEEPKFVDRKTKQSHRWVVEWTVEEDYKLFEKYVSIGSKWV